MQERKASVREGAEMGGCQGGKERGMRKRARKGAGSREQIDMVTTVHLGPSGPYQRQAGIRLPTHSHASLRPRDYSKGFAGL